MELSKSVDFLLDKAGDAIKYRLRKEILHDLSEADEANYLEKIMRLPYYQLLEKYQKANGFIGVGLHSYDKFQETPLQDAENAARLISYYAIPKTIPLVRRFAEALRNEIILENEFSFFRACLEYPGPYNDVRLEPDYKTELSIWCDLTFWAVQFLSLYDANLTQSSSIIFE